MKETVLIGAVYTLTEIALWAGGAGILGFGLGWLVKRRFIASGIHRHYVDLIADEERRRGELRLELEDHKTQTASLKMALQARTIELDRKSSDLERASVQIGRCDAAMTKLETDLTAALTEVAKLRGQKVDREATIATLRSMTNGSPVAAGNIEQELDAAHAAISRLRIDTASYQTTIAALSRQLQQNGKSVGQAAVADEVDKLRSRLAAVTSEKARTALELHELREIHAACGTSDSEADLTVVVAETGRPDGSSAMSAAHRMTVNQDRSR